METLLVPWHLFNPYLRISCSPTMGPETTWFLPWNSTKTLDNDAWMNELPQNWSIPSNAKEKWVQVYTFKFLDQDNFKEWIEGLLLKDQEPNIFKEPFQSIWQKLGAFLCYVLMVIESLILLAFIAYETQGLAGPSRTVINQLVSYTYLMAVLYVLGPVGIDMFRTWFGPLPSVICEMSIIAKNTICVTGLLMIVIIAFIKFMFICVWKNMRPLDDNFLARFIIRMSFMLSLISSLFKSNGPDKPLMNMIICTGHFNPLKPVSQTGFPLDQLSIGFLFLTYTGLIIAIFVQKRKIQKEEENVHGLEVNENQIPKNLESLALKFVIMGTMLACVCCTHVMNQTWPSELDHGTNWICPYFNYFIAPLVILSLIAIKIGMSYGKDIRREFFGTSIQPIPQERNA